MRYNIYIITLLLSLLSFKLNSQTCTLANTIRSNTQVKNCINTACATNCGGLINLVVPNGVSINLNGDWDLTSYSIKLELEGTTSRINFDNSNEDILLSSTSYVLISPTNTNGLTANNGGNTRITIGTTTFKGNDFVAIISAGGATISGPGIPVVLPIELGEFKAINVGDYIELNWFTYSEKDNDYFVIEKSTDGLNFEVITQLNGAGTSNKVLSYSFLDTDIPSSLMFYRLKQVDYDGAFEYSQIISVNAKTSNSSGVVVYPNPASDQITLGFNRIISEDYSFQITNSDASIIVNGMSAVNEVIDISNLDSGIYYLSVFLDDEIIREKFVIK